MHHRKIYLATSWRHPGYPEILAKLQAEGHEVYDFRDPEYAFHWSDIHEFWQVWIPAEFRKQLKHPKAVRGFNRDKEALDWCDTCILLNPCGRSAHLELGYAIGQGKQGIIWLDSGEPELMYRFARHIVINYDELSLLLKQRL